MPSLPPQIARAVQNAVRWIKANERTIVDSRDCAIAISALVAAERSSHATTIQHLVRKLRAANPDATSWNDEVWDTVWGARALLEQAVPREGMRLTSTVARSEPLVRGAIEFILAVRDSVRGFWYGEPFETMIALDLLLAAGHDNFDSIAKEPLTWLLSLQSNDGRVIAPHFTGIFASVLSRLAKAGMLELKDRALAAAQWLANDLETHRIWTSAAWSNAHALQGLLDNGFTMEDHAVRRAVEWFVDTQSEEGQWSHVATVDDTSMAVLALMPLLSETLINLAPPLNGTITAIRTNGEIRLTFEPPAGRGLVPEEFVKFPEDVAKELRKSQLAVLTLADEFRGEGEVGTKTPREFRDQIFEMGVFAHDQLFRGCKLDERIRDSRVDHLRINIDERLIDLPWELTHDGDDFLCLKYAVARQIYASGAFEQEVYRKENVRALIVSDPGANLEGAREEGNAVAALLRAHGLDVTHLQGNEATKQRFNLEIKHHQIIHFAGHASQDRANPDESCIRLSDGPFKAFRMEGVFGRRPPALVFLNACWSAAERSAERGYPPMMRGLARTFLVAGVSNFLGYLIPVVDRTATDLALHFYSHLVLGRTVGEGLRRSRVELREKYGDVDPAWASAILYGDPTSIPIQPFRAR
jgi:hypothetical protein